MGCKYKVLFPEGGGQPFDTGSIDNVKVYNVQRQRLAHVHYTKEPVPVGKTVTVKLDWDRRWYMDTFKKMRGARTAGLTY